MLCSQHQGSLLPPGPRQPGSSGTLGTALPTLSRQASRIFGNHQKTAGTSEEHAFAPACTAHTRSQGRRPQQQHPRAGAVGSATRQGAKREPPTVGCTCLPSLQRSQLTGARSSRQQTLIGTPNTAWSSFPAARRGSMWPIYPAWRTG